MKIQKTEGIVIRWFELGDTSKVVTLYTRDFGKIKVVAKGLKKMKSKFGAAMELFSLAEIVFYKKANRELQLLSDAELLEEYSGFKEDYLKFQAANCLVQLLDKFTPDEEKDARLFNMLRKALALLSQAESSPDLVVLSYIFSIKLIALAGYRPELDSCVECQGDAFDWDKAYLYPSAGGVLCANCIKGKAGLLKINHTIISILKEFLNCTLEKYSIFSLTSKQEQIIIRYLQMTIMENTGKKINSCNEIWQRSDNG